MTPNPILRTSQTTNGYLAASACWLAALALQDTHPLIWAPLLAIGSLGYLTHWINHLTRHIDPLALSFIAGWAIITGLAGRETGWGWTTTAIIACWFAAWAVLEDHQNTTP